MTQAALVLSSCKTTTAQPASFALCMMIFPVTENPSFPHLQGIIKTRPFDNEGMSCGGGHKALEWRRASVARHHICYALRDYSLLVVSDPGERLCFLRGPHFFGIPVFSPIPRLPIGLIIALSVTRLRACSKSDCSHPSIPMQYAREGTNPGLFGG